MLNQDKVKQMQPIYPYNSSRIALEYTVIPISAEVGILGVYARTHNMLILSIREYGEELPVVMPESTIRQYCETWA